MEGKKLLAAHHIGPALAASGKLNVTVFSLGDSLSTLLKTTASGKCGGNGHMNTCGEVAPMGRLKLVGCCSVSEMGRGGRHPSPHPQPLGKPASPLCPSSSQGKGLRADLSVEVQVVTYLCTRRERDRE